MTDPNYPFPADRHYDRETHLWVLSDPGNSHLQVGIDVLGLAALGDLAYISLGVTDKAVRRGDAVGTLEAAKMTGEILSPVSGTVRRRNEDAVRDPSLVNADPYGCWLLVIEPDAWNSESALLVSGSDLGDWVAAELVRYRAEGWIE